MTPVATQLSAVYPLGSRINERGRLEIGGCDTIELAREFGTPAYIVAEEDLRARARAYTDAFRSAGHADFLVTFASKAFPSSAVIALFAQEGLGCDVASAGELHLALRAGCDPRRIVYHGNARSLAELEAGVAAGVGLVVIDNFDDIEKLERIGAPQHVLIRVTPGVSGETNAKISTGQSDSKFGLGPADTREAIERIAAGGLLSLDGLHMHIGSQLLELGPFSRAIEVLAELGGPHPVYDLGGGLGVAYSPDQQPPAVADYVGTLLATVEQRIAPDRRILLEPGRSLTANGCVTLYTVESVKQNVRRWVAVDGGMSDNLRPMLYDAPYEVEVADRFGGSTKVTVAGKHCESGDVIVRDAQLENPRPGDVLVTPATGAYGHAMANNYNGVPRPPVIFCKDGDARVVVRRETLEDLEARERLL